MRLVVFEGTIRKGKTRKKKNFSKAGNKGFRQNNYGKEISKYGGFSTFYTSHNPCTILGSSEKIRMRHLKHANLDILVFACSHMLYISPKL